MKSPLATALVRTTLATLAVAALNAPVAQAQQAFPLFSTGINSGGTTIAAGSQDPYWTWQSAAYPSGVPSGSPAETYVPTNEFVDWQADVANQYHWVSSTSNANGNGGYDLWSTTFDLSAYDPTTASITFKCTVDNTFISVFLNGTATTALCGDGHTNDFKFGADYTLASGFIQGDNTLSIFSAGDGITDGVLVDIESAEATLGAPIPTSSTPEPASMVLMATGLVGLVPVLRRRRRA